jgi:PucR C-terminal helix-turn-helix domain
MKDVQSAVDQLGTSLAHPVLVEDARHRPIWWSAQGQVDGTRMRTILQHEVEPAARAVVARLGLARARGPVRTPAAPEADMLPRWCVPLRSGRELLGYLWVLDGDETVTEQHLPQIVACADLAASYLAQSPMTSAGRVRRRAALLARLAAGPDDNAARDLIALEELDPLATVVVNAPRAETGAGAGWPLRGDMSVHASPPPGAAATSGPPLPLAQLHLAVRRASLTRQVIRAGAVLARPSFDALGSWHLIASAPADLAVADIHPGAEVLVRQRRPDLMITARTVLDYGGDIAKAAAQLHIHRTTLYYRLDRIEALTGVSLKTGPERDDLHMALRLAAFRLADAPGARSGRPAS